MKGIFGPKSTLDNGIYVFMKPNDSFERVHSCRTHKERQHQHHSPVGTYLYKLTGRYGTVRYGRDSSTSYGTVDTVTSIAVR